MYDLKGAKPPKVFQSLSDSSVAALEIMKQEPSTRAEIELDDKGWVVESRPHPETPVSSLMKRKDAIFAASSFCLRDSGLINITVPHASDSTSTALIHPKVRQRF